MWNRKLSRRFPYHVFILLLAVSLARQAFPKTEALPSLERFVLVPRGGVRQAKRRFNPTDHHVGQNDTKPFFVEEVVVVDEERQDVITGSSTSLVAEALSGMTVALASIPSSIAYASIANLSPAVGIWSSVVLGAVTSLAGMRSGLIAGSAGVVAVPLAKVLSTHGKAYMAPTILLAGFMELTFGLVKGGKLINLVSEPVMTGFLNGLGFLLLKSQLKVFVSPGSASFMSLLPTNQLLSTMAVAGLTSALSLSLPTFLPGQGWPTALISIVCATIVSQALVLPVSKLSIGGQTSSTGNAWSSLPSFVGLPTGEASLLSMKTLGIIAPAAFSIAVISILETLLSTKVLDEAEEKDSGENISGDSTKDTSCIALALGNAASALFGGFGGCGLIPQSLLNYQTGGRGIASVLSYSAILATSILFCSSLINKVPTACLAGVMILVAVKTIQWKPTTTAMGKACNSIVGNKKMRSDDLVKLIALAVSSLVCVSVDMGTGIMLGVLLEKVLPLILARF